MTLKSNTRMASLKNFEVVVAPTPCGKFRKITIFFFRKVVEAPYLLGGKTTKLPICFIAT
jgi:hypothetical protein